MTRPRVLPSPEFASGEDLPPSALSRREFLRYSAASMALASAALDGCTRAPAEKIVPYRVQPEGVVPGRARHYASAATLDGYATGILVESHAGRPTKIEGNPQHPASLGASSALEQSLLLELYDPERLRTPTRDGAPIAEGEWLAPVRRAAEKGKAGRGVHLVLRPVSSPLLASQLAALGAQLPELSVHFHAPLSRTTVWHGAARAFGAVLDTRVELANADVVVTLDSNALASGPNHLALARAFADRRRVRQPSDGMNRLDALESAMSVTGGMADHRLAVRPSQLAALAGALLREVARGSGRRYRRHFWAHYQSP